MLTACSDNVYQELVLSDKARQIAAATVAECEKTHTIMKPAVILPSHIPKPKRSTASPAKLEQAAKQHRKMAQSVMLKL